MLGGRRVIVLLLDEVQLRLESRVGLRVLAVLLLFEQVDLAGLLDLLEQRVNLRLLLLDCGLQCLQLLGLRLELDLGLVVALLRKPERLLELDQQLPQLFELGLAQIRVIQPGFSEWQMGSGA